MSVRRVHTEFDTFYFITFTCYHWIPLFEITNLYNFIYRCFDMNKSKGIYTCGYVIMPNHLHTLVYTKNKKDTINQIVSESKRFMAYEIVKRLKKTGRNELLTIMHNSVNPNDVSKGQIHNVFQSSLDIKRIITEKFIRQKLNYMHKNPVSGKWRLVEQYHDYAHSSARFYDMGEHGIYNVVSYSDAMNISAGCSARNSR